MGECESISWLSGKFISPLWKPIDHDMLAPFVKMWIEGSENEPDITVGNESCPSICKTKHTAVIKSFEYGYTDGIQCKIEILDEEGGSFADISKKLFKCINKAKQEYRMKVVWGWVYADCNSTGSKGMWKSPVVTFLPMNIECHYTKAAIRYTITGTDLMQAVFNARKMKTYGTEADPMKLKDALPEMFNDLEPKINFDRARRQGKTMLTGDAAYNWKDIDDVGGVWQSDGQNKSATGMRWTESFRTTHDKGVVPFWGAGEDNPTIYYLEAGGQDCNPEPGEMEARSVGTFITHGGKCSPVIDFSPQINWVAAFAQLASGGQAGSGAQGKMLEQDNQRPTGCKVQSGESEKEVGLQTSVDNNSNQVRAYGFKESVKETSLSQQANEKASNISNLTHPIQAELRIQGNPESCFVTFQEAVARTVAIVAKNPWHLKGGNSVGGCPDWTSKPPVNPVLTNKFWWIFGFNHSIKEGSYVTTLKVRLDAPGIDLVGGAPAGGDPSATEWIPNAC